MKKLNFLLKPVTLLLFLSAIVISAADRFPRPEFDNNHTIPTPVVPQPVPDILHIIDLALLLFVLAAASFFIFRRRSRSGVAGILIFSLLYFGFYKKGCMCAVGAVQNVTLAIADPSYHISWVVFAIFAIPLIFTLFFGRIFCGSVCPLGAIQDIFIFKPVKVPAWLEEIMGVIPYFYLGLAVLFAATKSGFIICRYDPFVAFFRLSGDKMMILTGTVILLTGVFVARPYCRYLCPYGVLLRFASLFSRRHLSITPDECIKCRLCENSCPFGAIRKPVSEKIPESRGTGVNRLLKILLFAPFIILLFTFAGRLAAPLLAEFNPKVKIAEHLNSELKNAPLTRGVDPAFSELISDAEVIKKDFIAAGTILGLFLGLVIACKLISLSIYPSGNSYRPDKMKCLSCGRCLSSCPVKPDKI
jgi:ferredoxin